MNSLIPLRYEQKRKDSYELVEFMQKVTGYPPKCGVLPLLALAAITINPSGAYKKGLALSGIPTKAAISLYVFRGPEHEYLLEGLGKYKMGRLAYICQEMADIDLAVLEKLICATIEFWKINMGKINRGK